MRVSFPAHRVQLAINRVSLPILLVVSGTGKIFFPLSPFAPEDLALRDRFGSPVPRQLICETQAESGDYSLSRASLLPLAFRDGVRPSIPPSQSRVCRVNQLRDDGFYRRESAGTGAAVLKVAREAGAAYSGYPMDQFLCATLIFSHTH